MGVTSPASAGPQMWVRGPTDRQPAPAGTPSPTPPPAAPDSRPAPGWPPPARHRPERIGWVGAHGGAGTSRLAGELGGVDVGRRWPDPARGEPGSALLVARTHAAGLAAASQAMDALRKGQPHPAGVDLVALVLVADAPGRLPPVLARRVRVLRSAVPVHRIGWIPEWRLGERPGRTPKDVLALAGSVPALAGNARQAT